MRRFVDLHLKTPEDESKVQTMLELAAKLGFRGVALTSENPLSEQLRDLTQYLDLDLVSRIDLSPDNPRKLTSSLGKVRRRFEIIGVECNNKKVARQASKDHRVDVLILPSSLATRERVKFDRQSASLASEANCCYEVNLSDLLEQLEPTHRSRMFAIMRGEVGNAKSFDVPIVVSSGARNVLEMRDPRGLAAVLSLMDLGEEEGLDAISETPMGIVERNREKLGGKFIAPGVRVEKNCR